MNSTHWPAPQHTPPRRTPPQAASLFEELLAKYPQVEGVHYLYGCFLAPQDHEASAQEFRLELEHNPKHVPSLGMLALEHLKRGEAAAATRMRARPSRSPPPAILHIVSLAAALPNLATSMAASASLWKQYVSLPLTPRSTGRSHLYTAARDVRRTPSESAPLLVVLSRAKLRAEIVRGFAFPKALTS